MSSTTWLPFVIARPPSPVPSSTTMTATFVINRPASPVLSSTTTALATATTTNPRDAVPDRFSKRARVGTTTTTTSTDSNSTTTAEKVTARATATAAASRGRETGHRNGDDVRRNGSAATKDADENDDDSAASSGSIKAHVRRLVLWGLLGYEWKDDDLDDDDVVTVGAAPEQPAKSREDRIADALDELSDFLVDENESNDNNVEDEGEGVDDESNDLPVREAVDEYNAAMITMSILQNNPNHVRLLQEGFFFLTNWIHHNPTGARRAARHGTAQLAVDAMRRFPDIEELQWRALECLDNVHYYASTSRRTHFVKTLRGIDCVVTAMKQYPDNVHLQDRAISLLAWICHVPELRSDVFRANAYSLVVTAVETHVHGNQTTATTLAVVVAGTPPKNDLHRLAREVVQHLAPFL